MPHHQRGLRAELAAILSVDQYTLEDLVDDPAPPYEPTSTRLAHLIIHAIHHPIEARAVYAFLPVLVLRIFGYTAGQGWLETISQLPSKDREALLTVVLPDGPLHTFCKLACDNEDGSLPSISGPVARDMRFEFSVNNLPTSTRQALHAPPDDTKVAANSYLAPLLRPHLKAHYGDVVLLDPLTYFILCLVASPANKYPSDGVPEGTNPVTAKKIKRSSSLPSTRALYNHVLAAYAASCSPMQRADAAPIILPAILDMLFMPWALATPDSAPVPSAASADAVATVLLTLCPPAPEALELQPGLSLLSSPPPAPLTSLTTAAALYRLVPYIVCNALAHLTPGDTAVAPFLGYTRVLALHIAPWRSSVRKAIRAMLFSKPKRGDRPSRPLGTSGVQSSLANTVASLNAHFTTPYHSPDRPSSATDSRWRLAVAERIRTVDTDLVVNDVVRAAAFGVGALTEGARTLAALTDAVQAAKMSDAVATATRSDGPAAARQDELALCIEGLRSNLSDLDPKGLSKWERSFIGPLAAAVGVRIQTSGVLQNISDMVQGSAHSVKDVMGRVAGASRSPDSGTSGLKKRRVHDRRLSMLNAIGSGNDKIEIPFFGNVWDRPIESGEFEPMVLFAYWLALKLEPYIGFLPDTRFMGRFWFLFSMLALALVVMLVRAALCSKTPV